jgi:ABC-type multidrug transport system ATPase subunit
MKRKLLVCLAMYTGALSVFLDEPSTGMDPFSRRALWSVILEALSKSRSVLLTTHSMEEADAVCGRISIIASGRIRCIGTSQHLKNRFGSGYVCVLLHDSNADVAKIDDALKQHFGSGVEVQEVLGLQRRYSLGSLRSLAAAFKFLESQRDALQLHQYSVSQTVSLEQIFLNFVGTHNADA